MFGSRPVAPFLSLVHVLLLLQAHHLAAFTSPYPNSRVCSSRLKGYFSVTTPRQRPNFASKLSHVHQLGIGRGGWVATATGSAGGTGPSSRERITITVSTTVPSVYELRQTVYSGTSAVETWCVTKSWSEIDDWQIRTNRKLGFILPPIPPQEAAAKNHFLMEAYLNQVIQIDGLWANNKDAGDVLSFFDVPSFVREDLATPTYSVDVFDVDGTPITGKEKDAKDVKTGALLAGATAGFVLGGPFGAALGALAANSASARDDSLGDLTRTAGKGVMAAVKQVKRLNDRYDLTERGKDIFKKGVDTVKNVVDKLDE